MSQTEKNQLNFEDPETQIQHLYVLYGCRDWGCSCDNNYDSILCGIDKMVSSLENKVIGLNEELIQIKIDKNYRERYYD